ncbi:VOC family protein [Paenibacillus thalictri]|uniref:VOC family protein n=1 Tax=Paenibacillus thalictri TaxID=2527873 RepID=A0A4Q9DH47_9BACL|nr:VOC family protein [Paenibacillus thalictri]TBL70296.1 VOC family protein [Paenibacillus thalictri]
MFTTMDHIAIAVWDIDQSLGYYTEQLGLALIHDEYLESAGVRLAYLKLGNNMIQLVQPIGDTPVRKFLEEKGEGLHHICLATDNIPYTLDKLDGEDNTKVVMGGRNRRACFIGRKPNGLAIELTENDPYTGVV